MVMQIKGTELGTLDLCKELIYSALGDNNCPNEEDN